MKKLLIFIGLLILTGCQEQTDFREELAPKLIDAGFEVNDEVDSGGMLIEEADHYLLTEYSEEDNTLNIYVFNIKTGNYSVIMNKNWNFDTDSGAPQHIFSFAPFSETVSLDIRDLDVRNNCFLDAKYVKGEYENIEKDEEQLDCTKANLSTYFNEQLDFLLDVLGLNYDEFTDLYKY